MEAEDRKLRARPSYSYLRVDSVPDLPKTPSYILKPSSNRWLCYLSPSPLHVKRFIPSTGILTCCPSTTPFGLVLGSDLPWAESPGPGTLGFSAEMILTSLIATHLSISSCDTSSAPYGTPSSANTMLSYHFKSP